MKVKCFSTFITSKILNIPFNGINQHPHTIQSLAEICCNFSRKRFFLFLLLSFVWIFTAQRDPHHRVFWVLLCVSVVVWCQLWFGIVILPKPVPEAQTLWDCSSDTEPDRNTASSSGPWNGSYWRETLRAVSVYFPLVSLCSLYFDVLVKRYCWVSVK